MRIHLTMIMVLLCNTIGSANSPYTILEHITHNEPAHFPDTLECDTTYKGFEIRVVNEQGQILLENYDSSSSETRTEIENTFIAELKSFKGSRIPFEPIDTLRLEPYGEDKLIYSGDYYQNRLISRNIYLGIEDVCPVYDIQSPIESIANLFIFPSEISDSIKVDLTILRHEYGEKENLVIPLGQLLAACEYNGCVAFWGMEKYEDGILEGALFLYNKYRGYDHVIKVECNPETVLNKRGHIKARASLFIPTNNVRNLYAPYIKKDDNEKINYDN